MIKAKCLPMHSLLSFFPYFNLLPYFLRLHLLLLLSLLLFLLFFLLLQLLRLLRLLRLLLLPLLPLLLFPLPPLFQPSLFCTIYFVPNYSHRA